MGKRFIQACIESGQNKRTAVSLVSALQQLQFVLLSGHLSRLDFLDFKDCEVWICTTHNVTQRKASVIIYSSRTFRIKIYRHFLLNRRAWVLVWVVRV